MAIPVQREMLASFAYDGQGRRISETPASGTTFYHYAGDRVAYETDSTGTITKSFTYSSSGITGLYFLNARNYNPEIGRFINREG